VVFAVLAGVGLVILAMPGEPSAHGFGAFIFLFFLYLVVWLYLCIKNKSITVSGDRIQMVTSTGRQLDYSANQITKFRWDAPDGWSQRKGMRSGCLYFEGGASFVFEVNINDYRGLIKELSEIAPPNTAQMASRL
jgi:hypothetical protein